MDARAHWERIYRTRLPHEVSWFQREAAVSLGLIRRLVPDTTAPIIDVGGGASTLVDGLLAEGYRRVTVLDLSPSALMLARERLGAAAGEVTWLEADVLAADLPHRRFELWHDRAVFHFLTSPGDRARYLEQLRAAVRPRGTVIIATFAEDGPARCSGLPVVRYSPEALGRQFGPEFRLLESVREEHVTPAGARQAFVYCVCRLGAIEREDERAMREGSAARGER